MLKRRTFLKNTLAASATGVALNAGLMTAATADESAKANPFEANTLKDALAAAGISEYEMSDDIIVHAPDIAENGAVVTIKVEAKMADVAEVTVLIEENPTPYAASFFIGEGATPFVTSRFKMGGSSEVFGVVKVGDKYFANKKYVKVTRGGCGG